jgi:glycosyltransferase involved in cell wall biosynthesis
VISVVVAARNEEAFIGQCLSALSGQYRRPDEIVVIDNASVDGTRDIARRFACRIIDEPIVGQLKAKHRGIVEAYGDIVAVLDADCIPPAHWLDVIDRSFTDANGTAAVTCAYEFSDGLPWWGRLYVAGIDHVLIPVYRKLLPSMPYVVGGNVAFQKVYYERAGGYDLHAGIAETELGLARRLSRFGTIRYVPGMAVASSPRRFKTGLSSFLRYKAVDYLWGYYGRDAWRRRRGCRLSA